ncbi:DNA polymerase III subunit epsilon [Mycetohabitans sp. B8]|uniref:exonuclease domain-containing protein n=1 Tax=Mycetohabitans sp. B8 TaxID=2841845 RepID=UPI001F2EC720|nr:exonuclease domain-containing protein [Mycetohabitans sp. B8]MCG1041624.1 DNA polymerase III subunit epsilon [Mycetohabitans sp. B8]
MTDLASLIHDADARPLAFVDLETTGGRPGIDRITEVGVIEVDRDGVRRWSTLVDPLQPIPLFVQQLTGITDTMVRGAPTFDALAAELACRLDGKLFVAHNARFDHGFLKKAFDRVGIRFDPDVLCTVRLSRALFPRESRHGLDALAQRLELTACGRHRALADADLVWQFWQRVHALYPRPAIDAALSRLIRGGGADAMTDALPAGSGVYALFDSDGVPLYVGKSAKLRQRVRTQLFGERRSSRDAQLAARVHEVRVYPVVGEVGLLLADAHWTAVLRPRLGRRVAATMQPPRGAMPWPYGGPVALIERSGHDRAHGVHLLDAWHYLGSTTDLDRARALLDAHRQSRAACSDARDIVQPAQVAMAQPGLLGVVEPTFNAAIARILAQRLARGGLIVERLADDVALADGRHCQPAPPDAAHPTAPTPPVVQR